MFEKGKSGHRLKEELEERWLTSTVEPRWPLVEKIPAGAIQLQAQGSRRVTHECLHLAFDRNSKVSLQTVSPVQPPLLTVHTVSNLYKYEENGMTCAWSSPGLAKNQHETKHLYPSIYPFFPTTLD